MFRKIFGIKNSNSLHQTLLDEAAVAATILFCIEAILKEALHKQTSPFNVSIMPDWKEILFGSGEKYNYLAMCKPSVPWKKGGTQKSQFYAKGT